MDTRKLRAAIVGASTLLGRELAEQLASHALPEWDITLFDDEATAGQMTAAGDEALVIRTLAPGAFADQDVVFFASDKNVVRTHAKEIEQAGAVIVDLMGALEGTPGVAIGTPLLPLAAAPDLLTSAVVPAHPAALMLALVAVRLQSKFGRVKLIATLLQPASQHGKEAVDELHGQTAALLSFQSVPREVYDAQVAFNLQVSLGEDAKVVLADDGARVSRHFAALAPGADLQMQLVQAPVFHGYAASVYVETEQAATAEGIHAALAGTAVKVTGAGDESPSNQSATEQSEILITVQGAGSAAERNHWLWLAADNLRLAAQNAVACAADLAKLRPKGKVQ